MDAPALDAATAAASWWIGSEIEEEEDDSPSSSSLSPWLSLFLLDDAIIVFKNYAPSSTLVL